MFLSIIIPIYNGANDIVSCLNSIWVQNLPINEYEVICVDDCSKDDTCFVIEQEIVNHSNIRLLRNDVNKRAGGCRNYGVREARGEYILFIDADDYFHDGSLLQAFEYQKQKRLDILMCDSVRHVLNNPNNLMIHNFSNQTVMSGREFLVENGLPFSPWKYLFKKSVMLNNKLFFEESVSCEDVDWTHKMVFFANTMQYQPILLTHYILTTTSQTNMEYKSPNTVFHRFYCANRVSKLVSLCKTDQERKVILRVAKGTLDVGVLFLNALFSSPLVKRKIIVENIDKTIDWGQKINIIRRNALLYAVVSTLVSPFFVTLLVVKRNLLGR